MPALEGPRFGPASGGAPDSLVLLLHGVGADGFDLIDLAPVWAEALPNTLFIAPHAPFPFQGAPFGRQWFDIMDRTPARLEAGLRHAAAILGEFTRGELAQLGLGGDRLALMGFSQGAMVALFAGLRGAVRRPAFWPIPARFWARRASPPNAPPARPCCWYTVKRMRLCPPWPAAKLRGRCRRKMCPVISCCAPIWAMGWMMPGWPPAPRFWREACRI
jgi:phospholipase/carboxylesterase